jgi:starvation-inducible DNA-binding protein
MPPEGEERLAEKLDELLVDYEAYHQNLKQIHWNQRLRPYLDLTRKVGHLYEVTENNKQLIANQLLSLGYNPTLTDTPAMGLMRTGVSALSEVRNLEDAVFGIIRNSREMLQRIEEVFYLAAEYDEKQTMLLMQHMAQQLSFAIGVFASLRLATYN